MAQEINVDTVRSKSSGTIGRSTTTGHDVSITLDASGLPQPDGLTNSEAFLGGISSCGVTMIELHAQETGVPLERLAVTIEGSRDPEVAHYHAIHMRFEMAGVEQTQAEDLVKMYQGRCPLYGTVALGVKMTETVVTVPS